jgi:hypothetical protein
MDNYTINYIIKRLLKNADHAAEEAAKEPDNEFNIGIRQGYWEVLDTIKSEFMVADYDLEECGLDIDLDRKYMIGK